MDEYTKEESEEHLQIVSSAISRCEKMQRKFTEGISHHIHFMNIIKTINISKSLITKALKE